MTDLIQRHGWHVIAEVALLVLFAIFTAIWVTNLVRGRVRPVVCLECGRISSRADPRCARCGARLDRAPG